MKVPQKLNDLNLKIRSRFQEKSFFLQNGDEGWASAPSNIALLKYWGKVPHEVQIPTTPNTSMTLGGFRSLSKVVIQGRMIFDPEFKKKYFEHSFILNGKEEALKPSFLQIWEILWNHEFPEISFHLESSNNFPTACGIASSASGTAAFVGALADLLNLNKVFYKEDLDYWLFHMARIGSGSACRSIFQEKNLHFVSWIPTEDGKSCTFEKINKFGWNLKHSLLVINDQPKEVSSSQGHQQAEQSPYSLLREAYSWDRFYNIQNFILKSDLKGMSEYVENDTIALHTILHTSTKACYLNIQVALILKHLILYRTKTRKSFLWTMDAGQNIHLLYDEGVFEKSFWQDLLKSFHILKILHNQSYEGLCIGQDKIAELPSCLLKES